MFSGNIVLDEVKICNVNYEKKTKLWRHGNNDVVERGPSKPLTNDVYVDTSEEKIHIFFQVMETWNEFVNVIVTDKEARLWKILL